MILPSLCYSEAFGRKIIVGETFGRREVADDRRVSQCHVIRGVIGEGLT